MTVQKRNDQMTDLLSGDFQRRYEPNFALANIVSTMLILPELRGFWPFSSINESGNALDLSGQARTLTNNNATPRAVHNNTLPVFALNGTTRYFSRADEAGLDITGALTFGGWFYALTNSSKFLIGKDYVDGNRSYQISRSNTGVISTSVFPLGTTASAVSVNGSSIAANTYFFAAARFTPSTELAVFVNKTKTANVAAIPAATYNGTADFTIGASANPLYHLDGYGGLCFLCAAALPDATIKNIYEQTRAAFGV